MGPKHEIVIFKIRKIFPSFLFESLPDCYMLQTLPRQKVHKNRSFKKLEPDISGSPSLYDC